MICRFNGLTSATWKYCFVSQAILILAQFSWGCPKHRITMLIELLGSQLCESTDGFIVKKILHACCKQSFNYSPAWKCESVKLRSFQDEAVLVVANWIAHASFIRKKIRSGSWISRNQCLIVHSVWAFVNPKLEGYQFNFAKIKNLHSHH